MIGRRWPECHQQTGALTASVENQTQMSSQPAVDTAGRTYMSLPLAGTAELRHVTADKHLTDCQKPHAYTYNNVTSKNSKV